MKILIPDWKSFGKEDIEQTLKDMGHDITYYTQEPRNYRKDPKFRSELRRFLKQENVDMIFSSNYFPVLSMACMDLEIPYVSWCYDNPLVLTYSDTIFNPCNYVFLFDSQMVYDLQNLGATQVYYLPMAVSPARLDALHASPSQKKTVSADVSFVGALYNEKHNLYEKLENKDPYLEGYLEGVIRVQRKIYGYHLLEKTLTEDILSRLVKAVPLQTHSDGHETLAYMYANYFLCRKITQLDRTEALALLDSRTDIITKLYTPNPTPQYTHVQNMGTVQYQNEMPLVFRHSKINLNITLKSIANGIPLRAMDILGAGGFLLTNHQNDFLRHFTEGEDYVCYEDFDDMMGKIDHYLSHDKERREIAENGHAKASREHTYQQRFAEIFKILGNRAQSERR